jgi:hypothetical protein
MTLHGCDRACHRLSTSRDKSDTEASTSVKPIVLGGLCGQVQGFVWSSAWVCVHHVFSSYGHMVKWGVLCYFSPTKVASAPGWIDEKRHQGGSPPLRQTESICSRSRKVSETGGDEDSMDLCLIDFVCERKG